MTLLNRINAELKGDRVIWAIVAVLAIFSVLVVYSSTGTLAWRERGGNTEAYLFKHTMILGLGLTLTYLTYLMHFRRFAKWAPILLLVTVPLLLLTIAYGVEINDARRWLTIPGLGLSFQTSDFAKIALIIYVAREISSKQDYIKDWKHAFVPIIVPVLIVCGLIAPANLSTAVLLMGICIGMMFIGRVSLKYIGLLVLLGVVLFSALIFMGEFFPEYIRVGTWVSRMTDFVDNPQGSFQVQQAKIAIANGEWLGNGPGNSMQRNFLPSPYSDFIFAIICEEYGALGGTVIVLLYVALFFRVTRLVTKSAKTFGAMLAVGLTLLLVMQAFANIAVSVHLVPVTGLSLPMISMGGTSTLFSCIAFGIILSVSKHIEATAEN
ncbi:MAG: FtsW/RodA/SpoVE family cell cycle protein [Saprospiraceae bacterium]|nr:FtsW/RodA/SpoVE family cell cycle protein [Saprospiraceae bacterium]